MNFKVEVTASHFVGDFSIGAKEGVAMLPYDRRWVVNSGLFFQAIASL
jgi:hypothetical protein